MVRPLVLLSHRAIQFRFPGASWLKAAGQEKTHARGLMDENWYSTKNQDTEPEDGELENDGYEEDCDFATRACAGAG